MAVIVQGVLGGITVLFLLPTTISVAHASLAQTFLCLMVSMAYFASREWQNGHPQLECSGSPSLKVLCIGTVAAVYMQLVLGAIMRHMAAGLAIPDFPLALGRLVPDFTDAKIAIHFSHRVMAVLVTAMIVWTSTRVIRRRHNELRLLQLAMLLILLLILQVTLGAMTIWSQKDVLPTTAHVANGALILAMSWFLTLRVYRLSSADNIPRESGSAPASRFSK
jgi:cytochrome c oxidase assembly protein subunit 15